jgi:hypothetical protein
MPKGNKKLGSMANGLKIEGIGLTKCWFINTQEINLPIQSMAYFVLQAQLCLLSLSTTI